ncbi:hypothetical protein DAI22_04g009850 [Oryza sativa Japonica Group]|nr:hypothetical protein DAI22_04g009850 [Oryza sativa Japonica Group]
MKTPTSNPFRSNNSISSVFPGGGASSISSAFRAFPGGRRRPRIYHRVRAAVASGGTEKRSLLKHEVIDLEMLPAIGVTGGEVSDLGTWVSGVQERGNRTWKNRRTGHSSGDQPKQQNGRHLE